MNLLHTLFSISGGHTILLLIQNKNTPLKTIQRLVSFTLQNAAWIAAEDQFDQEVSQIELA